jgi:uncharacterized membrane protein
MGKRIMAHHTYRVLPGISATVLTLLALPALGAPTYTVTALGTLGGSYVYGRSVNASGQVTGNTNISVPQAVICNGTTLQGLGTLGGSNSVGYGINDSGHITGDS